MRVIDILVLHQLGTRPYFLTNLYASPQVVLNYYHHRFVQICLCL